MGRKKDEKTIMQTTIAEIFVKLIDAYIVQEKKKRVLTGKRMSRTSVMEDAVLSLLTQQGVLERLLREQNVPAEEVQSIISRLKAEYGIVPKGEQSKA